MREFVIQWRLTPSQPGCRERMRTMLKAGRMRVRRGRGGSGGRGGGGWTKKKK